MCTYKNVMMIMLMVLMVLEVMKLYQVTGKMVLAVAKICEKAAQSSKSGQKVITLLLTSNGVHCGKKSIMSIIVATSL